MFYILEYARKDGEAIRGITIKIYEHNRNNEIGIQEYDPSKG